MLLLAIQMLNISMTANVLPSPPDTIILPDDVLADIYNDMEADYWIEQEKSGLLDVE